jgi:hypothetical protein
MAWSPDEPCETRARKRTVPTTQLPKTPYLWRWAMGGRRWVSGGPPIADVRTTNLLPARQVCKAAMTQQQHSESNIVLAATLDYTEAAHQALQL